MRNLQRIEHGVPTKNEGLVGSVQLTWEAGNDFFSRYRKIRFMAKTDFQFDQFRNSLKCIYCLFQMDLRYNTEVSLLNKMNGRNILTRVINR